MGLNKLLPIIEITIAGRDSMAIRITLTIDILETIRLLLTKGEPGISTDEIEFHNIKRMYPDTTVSVLGKNIKLGTLVKV